MMTFVALWPDNTTSVVLMPEGSEDVDLFAQLDEIGNPMSAKVWRLKRSHIVVPLHVTFEWQRGPGLMDISGSADKGGISAVVGSGAVSPDTRGVRLSVVGGGRAKKQKWRPCIVRRFLHTSYACSSLREEVRVATLSGEFGKMLSDMPHPPPPKYTAKQVNEMKPFAGVYIAWDSDGSAHYVGEALNVPARVQKSRVEIGDRKIGVIECDQNERMRLESLFIGLLNPRGNCQSNERVAARDSARSAKNKG